MKTHKCRNILLIVIHCQKALEPQPRFSQLGPGVKARWASYHSPTPIRLHTLRNQNNSRPIDSGDSLKEHSSPHKRVSVTIVCRLTSDCAMKMRFVSPCVSYSWCFGAEENWGVTGEGGPGPERGGSVPHTPAAQWSHDGHGDPGQHHGAPAGRSGYREYRQYSVCVLCGQEK